ncbi:uncharacterized protein LOC114536783 [Dendronephthya gigantea]|nr:uncharacterized protein LOC114536783 [Dendronephthya gigantea]
MTLDKLSGIRGDLVRTDPEWETWDFEKLAEALRQWVKRNPVNESDPPRKDDYRKKLFRASGNEQKLLGCVYCGDLGHKAVSCTNVVNPSDRKQILARKGLCFNCATKFHRASDCASKTSCGHCNKRHHSSICEQYKHERDERSGQDHTKEGDQSPGAKKVMTDGASAEGIFPVVVVKVNGVMTRALIDSGAGSSYASAKLVNALNIKPSEIKSQRIDMLMTSQTKRIEVFDVEVSSLDDSCKINVSLNKVEKSELLTTSNPNYDQLVRRYKHLNSVKMDERDTKSELPIHLVLGNGEYARIKTRTKPLVGKDGDPVAEFTRFGWMIMSPGIELDQNTMLLTTTSQNDFERLCRLDVLGLEDPTEEGSQAIYDDFKDELTRDKEGWYETSLPWKSHHPHLPSNERGSIRRLNNLVKRLEKRGIYKEYNDIIQDQLVKGIVEPAPATAKGKEFYIPHKPVVKETAETTKLRVVYDASAKESASDPSLNECLNPGPPLQNHLWDILVRLRFLPIVLTADLEKAFLQVRIRENQRDSLRFHWKAPDSDDLTVYRFTRALFGLTCSPFLLGGVLNEHLKSWEKRYPALVEEIKGGLYVDDVMEGGDNVEEVKEKKAKTVSIFEDATFHLHKWHSNASELEDTDQSANEGNVGNPETTFAKQQLGTKGTETKILGMGWNKAQDRLSVVVNKERDAASTKREALSQVASVYDPLGLVSPTTLVAKLLYREMCEEQLAWDEELNGSLKRRWKEWYENLPGQYTVPRTLAPHREPVQSITLHGFGDASKNGVSAVVYAVAEQESGTTQGIVCAKSRLAKKSLTIPRLELVAGHMTANLVTNVERAIGMEKVTEIHCWLDSTVALYWINGQGEYRQFVSNRVKKVKELDRIRWHHVPTNENPADLGSRGGDVVGNELWKHGPTWLNNQETWPPEVVPVASSDSKQEEKPSTRVLVTMNQTAHEDVFDQLLERYTLRKTLRICAWINRFIQHTQRKAKSLGPIKTQEIEDARLWWIKRVQDGARDAPEFESTKIELNLQPNQNGILECRGRIEGEYPVYLPANSQFSKKLVEQAHIITLHGGVPATMAEVRERYWIPRLRRLVKQVRSKCHGCVRFRARAYHRPPPGRLPVTRTQGETPFQVIGVDFAGPIKYKTAGKAEKKAYLVLYACSLTRAVHLELLKSLEVVQFLPSLKRLIARRGRPQIIYSDNATTFKAAANWLKKAIGNEIINGFLTDKEIHWRFNLSRAPWWGGQFERLIGLFKRCFYKSIGNGNLTFEELSDVILDIEVVMNNRPLTYVEDDVEQTVLTPARMLQINPVILPEVESYHVEDHSLRKRAKFLRRCKDLLWRRWYREYVRGLRDRHRQDNGKNADHPNRGDAVIIEGEEKNRNLWKMGVVEELIRGRDDVVRGAKIRTPNGILERAIQQLYPIELSCDLPPPTTLNPDTPPFQPRPKRDAAAAAAIRLRDQAEEDER